jgi:hypothetical protein
MILTTERDLMRAQIAADVAAFTGTIEQLPMGQTAIDPVSGVAYSRLATIIAYRRRATAASAAGGNSGAKPRA